MSSVMACWFRDHVLGLRTEGFDMGRFTYDLSLGTLLTLS